MDATNRNTALASALVEELARSGVGRAVICPGSRSTPIALALLREPGIATTSVVDERSAAFLALGAANASRRPVAIACTSGTAAANLHPAVCEADEAAVPLVVLTSDRPPELRGIGAGQTIDQIGLYGSAVALVLRGRDPRGGRCRSAPPAGDGVPGRRRRRPATRAPVPCT